MLHDVIRLHREAIIVNAAWALALTLGTLVISRANAQTSAVVPTPPIVPTPIPPVLSPTIQSPNPTQPSPATAPVRPTIDLSVESSRPNTVIEHRLYTTSQWQSALGLPIYTWGDAWDQVCVTPCSVKVDPHASYRVGGDAAPSSRFVLPQGRSKLRLRVHAGSGFWYDAGVILASVGGTSTVAGGIVVFIAPKLSDAVSETTTREIGFALLGTGVALLLVGVPLWLANGSSVATDDGTKLAFSNRVHLGPTGVTF
jgi:hypothetical protein